MPAGSISSTSGTHTAARAATLDIMTPSSSEAPDQGVSRGASIVAIVASLTGVSAAFVAARLFVRIKMMRTLGLDDYLILLAMVCFPKSSLFPTEC